MLSASTHSTEGFSIETVSALSHPVEGILPWSDTSPANLEDQNPIFTLGDEDVEAKGWATVGQEGLAFRIVVTDPVQKNEFSERNLWRGDCVYLSFDALADSTDMRAAADAWQTDDGTVLLGLGSNGVEGLLNNSGDWRLRGKTLAPDQLTITRDELAKTTVYTGTIPWEWMHSGPGIGEQIGLAVTIAHKNKSGRDLSWGRIQASKDQPRELHYFTVAEPDKPFVSIAPVITDLFTEDSEAVIRVAFSRCQTSSIALAMNTREPKINSTGDRTDAVQRLRCLVPARMVDALNYQLEVKVNANALESRRSILLVNDTVVMARFVERIKTLGGNTADPVVREHLHSTLAVVRDAHQRLDLEKTAHPERVREFISAAETILEKLPIEKIDFDDAVSRGLPWVIAFVSEADRTLQYASLQFPFGWDRTKKYPLVTYLHGAGTDNPIEGLTTAFDNSRQDTLFRTEKIDPANVPPIHQAFVLAPWGRGNSMYRGNAEDDVLQAIALVKKQYAVDENRVYMTGFSMGCSGAFAIASRYPDQFAGILLASGFGKWSDTNLQPLWQNVRNTPIVAWVGSLDHMVDYAKEFTHDGTEAGLKIDLTVVPDLPHTYPYLHFSNGVGKLLTHSRQVPSEFSFISDELHYQGCWGVTMATPKRFANNPCAHFQCSIKGGVVTLTTENTIGLRFDPAPLGLDKLEEITILWNGMEAYRGVPKVVTLGESPRLYD